MMRTAFALLALATLAKNDASGRCRLADVCAECRRDVGNWAASFSRCHAGPGLVGRKAVASS
jgi:hypothetical protein